MKQAVIFGTGSFGELAHFYLEHDSDYEVAAFSVDDDKLRAGDAPREFRGRPVVAFEELADHYPPGDTDMFVAVGYRDLNQIRARVYREAKERGYTLLTYVSSKCTCWTDAIGDNCFIFEDNTIQPFVRIGNNTILWSGNHIGHHSTVGNHVFIASHVVVCGHVTIGDYSFLGVNATIRDDIAIGEHCVVGAGALVMKRARDRQVFIADRTKPFAQTSDQIRV